MNKQARATVAELAHSSDGPRRNGDVKLLLADTLVMSGAQPKRLIRRAEVEAKTTLSSSTIYKGIREGTFPRGRRIGNQGVVWLESEIDEWMDSLPEADPDDWLTPERKAGMRAARQGK